MGRIAAIARRSANSFSASPSAHPVGTGKRNGSQDDSQPIDRCRARSVARFAAGLARAPRRRRAAHASGAFAAARWQSEPAPSMALGGGVAVAGNGGTTVESDRRSASASSVTLKPGSRGPNVKRLQRKLRVQASGYYGPLTKKAVKRFQRRAGLEADGVAGPATLAKLRHPHHAPAADEPDERFERVEVPAELQRIAQCESGGNPRAVSPDGRYRGKYQFDLATWRGARRQRRSGRGARVGPGPARGQAVPPARHRPVGQLRQRVELWTRRSTATRRLVETYAKRSASPYPKSVRSRATWPNSPGKPSEDGEDLYVTLEGELDISNVERFEQALMELEQPAAAAGRARPARGAVHRLDGPVAAPERRRPRAAPVASRDDRVGQRRGAADHAHRRARPDPRRQDGPEARALVTTRPPRAGASTSERRPIASGAADARLEAQPLDDRLEARRASRTSRSARRCSAARRRRTAATCRSPAGCRGSARAGTRTGRGRRRRAGGSGRCTARSRCPAGIVWPISSYGSRAPCGRPPGSAGAAAASR